MVEKLWPRAANTVSREAVLQRIRSALAAGGPPRRAGMAEEDHRYQTQASLTPEEQLNLFVQRVEDYDARVFRSEPHSLAHDIAEVLLAAGRTKILVPCGIPRGWMDPRIEWVMDGTSDQALPYTELETFAGVLTGASVAVAESGTIVLQHGEHEGRRALTLLPDYHLCVLQASQIVETLPECFVRLEPGAAPAITFISGPSATADIEMTRIKGVHGPRFLDVMLLT